MSEPQGPKPPAQPPQRPVSLARWLAGFFLGLVAFGALNFVLVFALSSVALPAWLPALAIIALALGVAIWSYVAGRGRPFAAGVVIGYVLLSVASSGVCTLLVTQGGNDTLNSLFLGLFVYVIALVVAAVAAIVAGVVERTRSRRP